MCVAANEGNLPSLSQYPSTMCGCSVEALLLKARETVIVQGAEEFASLSMMHTNNKQHKARN